MKKALTFRAMVALLAIIFVASSFGYAKELDRSSLSNKQKSKAVIGYRYSLSHENPAVRHWTVNYIQRYELSELTPELIDVLNHDENQSVRYAAAVALVSVGGKDGREAVQKVAQSKLTPRLAEFCENLLVSSPEM
jgi:HEAT repeat protein